MAKKTPFLFRLARESWKLFKHVGWMILEPILNFFALILAMLIALASIGLVVGVIWALISAVRFMWENPIAF